MQLRLQLQARLLAWLQMEAVLARPRTLLLVQLQARETPLLVLHLPLELLLGPRPALLQLLPVRKQSTARAPVVIRMGL
jgi:hypothetical protein